MAKTPAIDLLSVITAHFLNFFSRKRIEISIHEETSVICMDGVHPLVISLMPQFPTGKYWEWATTYVSLVQFDSRKWTLAALRSKERLSTRVRSKTSWEEGKRQSESGEKRADSSKTKHVRSGEHTSLSLSLSLSLPPSAPPARRLPFCEFHRDRRLSGVCENH